MEDQTEWMYFCYVRYSMGPDIEPIILTINRFVSIFMLFCFFFNNKKKLNLKRNTYFWQNYILIYWTWSKFSMAQQGTSRDSNITMLKPKESKCSISKLTQGTIKQNERPTLKLE